MQPTTDYSTVFVHENGLKSSPLLFPAYHPEVNRTPNGTPYLTEPGVVLLAQSVVNMSGVRPFLDGFDKELGFGQYLDDPVDLDPSDQLVKFAGQLCYLSFGTSRTMNAEAAKYFQNLLESGHGSVLEHPAFSFLIYGVDRSFTHELVRHRVGVAFSQVSQRYVDGKCLRFVERAEYQNDHRLHTMFENWIDLNAKEYDLRASILSDLQTKGDPTMSGEKKRDLRKKVNQAARACLANETEAPIVFSANVRALRHIIEMRANPAADIQIRLVGVRLAQIVRKTSRLFEDHMVEKLHDGTSGIATKTRKV